MRREPAEALPPDRDVRQPLGQAHHRAEQDDAERGEHRPRDDGRAQPAQVEAGTSVRKLVCQRRPQAESAKTETLKTAFRGFGRFLIAWIAAAPTADGIAAPGPKPKPTARNPRPATLREPRP